MKEGDQRATFVYKTNAKCNSRKERKETRGGLFGDRVLKFYFSVSSTAEPEYEVVKGSMPRSKVNIPYGSCFDRDSEIQ